MFIPQFRLKTAVQRMLCECRDVLDFVEFHPTRGVKKLAAQETIDYVQSHMSGAIGVWTARQVLDMALRQAMKSGHFMEFGVYRGGTIRYIARQRPNTLIHGFDSFEGLPEAWNAMLEKGTFNRSGKPPRVPANVRLHKGLFANSIPEWAKANPGPIAFMHIDCDLYSSVSTILNALASQIMVGTVIVFDEYFGYPGWKNHSFKAFQEFAQYRFDYIAYARMQVAIRMRDLQ